MRVVVQRVSRASVEVDGRLTGAIGSGLLVLAGLADGDTQADLELIADKIVHLRIFGDEEGKMNRSLLDVGGGLLVVSQFTLHADCRKGRRPSFTRAAAPERATALFDEFVERLRGYGAPVETGVFGAMMNVELVNAGPVTIILDSDELKGPRNS
jgi:D-aminoacyl-tRNA deacylase